MEAVISNHAGTQGRGRVADLPCSGRKQLIRIQECQTAPEFGIPAPASSIAFQQREGGQRSSTPTVLTADNDKTGQM
jgi:hypothetical protein